jgi:hypothetical protein
MSSGKLFENFCKWDESPPPVESDADNRFAATPFDEADEWYAAECERLKERAPA